MKKIYKYYENFGRMGELESVFVADFETITKLIAAKEIPLGEALGKHSEVYARIADNTLTEISDDQSVVEFFYKHFGGSIGVDLVGRYDDLEVDGYYDRG